MFTPLPRTSEAFEILNWAEIAPWYYELLESPLTQETLRSWMVQWSDLSALVDETMWLLEIACTQNTADEEPLRRKKRFLEEIYTPQQALDQRIKERLLESSLEPEGFALPLRNLRAETALYREANLQPLNEDKALSDEYYQIGGAQMVSWNGEEVAITTLYSVLKSLDRTQREQAWRAIMARRGEDRDKLNMLWIKKMHLRNQIARNAGFECYRDYRWQQLLRFDYTPADCQAFHKAVEQVIVPAASQLWEKRRQQLGVEVLRPWDTLIDPRASGAPHRVSDVDTLLRQCIPVFQGIDPQLGNYFETMLQERLFDLEGRPNKAHSDYNLPLEVKHRPFIFGHVDSMADVVPLIFHEMGHAFHVFETISLPYIHQRKEGAIPLEFSEVASTSMEFIGAMHLHQAGLFTRQEAARLRVHYLERVLTNYLPAMVIGDAFQHWVYDHPEQGRDPVQCGQQWVELARRYQPAIDWSGLGETLESGWQWIPHFFCDPLYYIEYAFAALGALQVWTNYLRDPKAAIQQYRFALSLGATRTVPELYEAAGAKFAFDVEMLQRVVQLVTRTVVELEKQV